MFYFNFVLFLDVKSRLEGRMYEVRLPDGSFITVDPLLTQVKIIAKKSQIGKTLGLCQDADRACQSGECLIRTWRYVHFFIYLFFENGYHVQCSKYKQEIFDPFISIFKANRYDVGMCFCFS